MPRHRQQHDAPVAKHVTLTLKGVETLWLIPIGGQIAFGHPVFGPGRGHFVGMGDDRGTTEMLVAAAVIGVEVRTDHHVDIIGAQPDQAQLIDHGVRRLKDRHHRARHPAPARLGIDGRSRAASGIEQHVALRVAQQRRDHRQFKRFFARGARIIDPAPHAQPPARQEMHFHSIGPRSLASSRTAAMMC